MESQSLVETADRLSRKRASGMALAAAAFLIIQLVARPFFTGSDPATPVQTTFWAINVIALLLLLATQGGFLYNQRLRGLVLDEVARSHYHTAIMTGYWIALPLAVGLYLLAGEGAFSAREAIYLIVTPSLIVALFTFAFLEYRAQHDE